MGTRALLSLGDSRPIYKKRVMRGAGPVIPEWAGAHLLILTATLQVP